MSQLERRFRQMLPDWLMHLWSRLYQCPHEADGPPLVWGSLLVSGVCQYHRFHRGPHVGPEMWIVDVGDDE